MKVFLAPLISAAILVNAATDYPIKYVNNAAATAQPVDANQNVPDLYGDTIQKSPAQDEVYMPSLTIAADPKPTTVAEINVDVKSTDNKEFDYKTTLTVPSSAKQTPEVTDSKKSGSTSKQELEEDSPDFEDDNLDKPAGIDFPDAEKSGKETEPEEKEDEATEDEDEDDTTEQEDEPAEKDVEQTKKEPITFTTKTMTNFTISTVYATVTSTVTDCTSTVTYCPEKGTVVTKTISLYTTVCPETTATSIATPIARPELPESDLDSELPDSELQDSDFSEPEAPEPTPASYLTKTVETTVWYTVTECPPKATNCPIGLETSSISTYTEVYPVTDLPYPTPSEDYEATETQYNPYGTGSPSNYPVAPKTNVTMPTTPPNFSVNAGSLKKADGLLMFIGLGIAAAATALLQ